MSNDSDSMPSSGSGSGSGRSRDEDSGHLASERGIPIEVTLQTRMDSTEKVAENELPAKARFEWVAANVWTQYSLFKWSQILNALLNCVLVLERGTRPKLVLLERVSVVKCVCHGYEGAKE
ncbi:hypothetical protein DEO72_LG7g1094 [Vigna unguiculata]|uniref:Uncharacterized protein n=1 Tax=Vigna unguiculata TaxID=3917 RepID=A0A4D6MHU9_VIGUN|nr:hypothetical protein DEO72_LG7g1094 [Vigna unguiculata]